MESGEVVVGFTTEVYGRGPHIPTPQPPAPFPKEVVVGLTIEVYRKGAGSRGCSKHGGGFND